MPADLDRKALADAVDRFVRSGFRASVVVSVEVGEVRPAEVWDVVDEVVDVTIHLQGTPAEIARAEPPGFITRLRTLFVELGETALPIVGFRSTLPNGAASTEAEPKAVTGVSGAPQPEAFLKLRNLADDVRYERHSPTVLAASIRTVAEEVRTALRTDASAAEAAMRERCAQVCDDYSKASDAYVQRAIAERLSSSATYIGMRSAADRCAEKIRALPLSPGGQRDA